MTSRDAPGYEIRYELDGWEIFFAELAIQRDTNAGLEDLRRRTERRVRQDSSLDTLASRPPVSALRKLFKAAGCDPSRYRPASEALLRRILKGEEIPAIHPLVDVNNCLSATLAVPCCVMAEGSFDPPFLFRAGREGESYESLKGPFELAGKPLLLDAIGPCDAPITGSERVKVRDETTRATLVVYLPRGVVTSAEAGEVLDSLLEGGPVARAPARGKSSNEAI
jgi:DNA/RNA-binding domain of Phe-tRNA-synthetase-like protein